MGQTFTAEQVVESLLADKQITLIGFVSLVRWLHLKKKSRLLAGEQRLVPGCLLRKADEDGLKYVSVCVSLPGVVFNAKSLLELEHCFKNMLQRPNFTRISVQPKYAHFKLLIVEIKAAIKSYW